MDQHYKVQRRRDREESPDGRFHKDRKKKKKKDHCKSHKHKHSRDSDSSLVDMESKKEDKRDLEKSKTNHGRGYDDEGRKETSSNKPGTSQDGFTGSGNQDYWQENYRKHKESSEYKKRRSESGVDSDKVERYKGEQSGDRKKYSKDKYRKDDVISSHAEKKTHAENRYREKRTYQDAENRKIKHRKSDQNDRSEERRTKESSYLSEDGYKHCLGKLESSREETQNKRCKYEPDDLSEREKRDDRQKLACDHSTKHKGDNKSRYKRGQCDDSSEGSSSDSEAEGSEDEQTSPDFDFDWERHRRQLSEVFFKDNDLIKKGSEAYEDFWAFVKKYQMFQRRKSMQATKKKKKKKEKTEGQFDIPEKYDKRYRINLSFVTKDLDVYLRQGIRKGEGPNELTSERLLQFRQIIFYYLDFIQKQKFSRLLKLRQDQQNLPIYQYKEKIVEMVRDHQVVVVAGDTGCGKSTQVPQYLLEAGFKNIACTQPRRIACISLSKRVGYETLNEYGSEVAYQVRFEKTKTKSTRILFLTEGLLLRQVQSDGRLSQYDVIVIDEVHERHIHTDFLLGVLKCMLHQRADLKLVLMSATINIHLFSSYFNDCPVVKVPGRLYPIQLEYCPLSVEDMADRTGRLDPRPYLRIMQKIDHKYPETERGDLLIFLSGMSEIMSVVEAARMYAQESKKWIVLPLHSALSIEEQDKVFDIPPESVRKCIVSTNIAETSVTIDGVRFIVDSGKVKEMNFDSKTKLQRLQEFWISQASAEQRKGRAGRTGPGVCFRLYDESDFHEFQEYSTPEIQRVALDSLILQMVAMGLPDARKFPFLEAPSESSIENSIAFLKDQGAITGDEKLTPIGEMLSQLPVDVVMGKMLIMGSIFHMMDPVLSISAALSVQSPFTNKGRIDLDVMTQRRPLESDHGDPFTLLNTFDEWIQVKAEGRGTKKWCRRRGLEEQRFYEMSKLKQQFRELLREHNLLEGEHESQRYMSREERRQRHKDQQKLRVMRREERNKSRKRKMLKLEEEDFELSDWDAEPEEEGGQDLKDLEFRLTNNLSQMQEKSNKSRSFTLRDINLLKVVLCSGLYPQIGIADEHNSYKSDSDQLFHTKSKPFVMLHPTSVFTSHPDLLELKQRDIKEKGHMDSREPFSNKHQLVSYVTLLETTKPFLTGVMRVPALQTLLLYAHSLDTNTDLTRVVCDGWLELRFEDPDTAEQLISSVVQLRVNWQNLIRMKLQDTFARSVDGDKTPETSTRYKARRLERVLATKLTDFLDSDVVYAVRRVLAAELEHLYKGPEDDKKEEHKILKDLFSSSGAPHPVKGGIQVNSFLTYDCLQADATASVWGEYTSYMQKHWTCPRCQQSLIVTVVERLQHEQHCGTDSKETPELSGDATLDQSADSQSDGLEHLRKLYHCPTCDTDYKFTATETLKHKKSCKP